MSKQNRDTLILFWSTYNTITDINYEIWRDKDIKLTPLHILSLYSYIKYKNKVLLYTYQNINKHEIPYGIEIKDANKIFSSTKAYIALKNGHSIAHISDAVRLNVASELCGIVLDIDAVMIKPFPNYDGFFSSMPAKATGGFAPKWGKSHPPLYIHDKTWDGKALSCFPLKVNKKISPYIKKLSFKIMRALLKPVKKGSKAWNYVMWELKILAKIDIESPVLKPIYNCPLPAWMPAGKCYSLESPTRLNGGTELFGYKLPSFNEIFNMSYIIQHFFESAFQKKKVIKGKFWSEKVTSDCLLGYEAKHILGDSWRNFLSDF